MAYLEIVVPTIVTTDNGNQILKLPLGGGYSWGFGLSKAKAMIKHKHDIALYLESEGAQTGSCFVGQYKGHTLITIPKDRGKPFSIGKGKATSVIENMTEICEFVDQLDWEDSNIE